jgi:hypothetical protein
MWQEAVVAPSEVLSWNLPEETEETHENPAMIFGIRVDGSTRGLPNMKHSIATFGFRFLNTWPTGPNCAKDCPDI